MAGLTKEQIDAWNKRNQGAFQGLLNVNQFVPVSGDIQSGIMAAKDVKEGNYGSAALNAVGLLPFIPALGGITAWHGSPHTFNQFDLSKIGTGEGAQAYGHGLYFAESPKVAKQYASELGTKVDVNGVPLYEKGKIVGSTGNPTLDDYLVANLGNAKQAKKDILADIKDIRKTNPEGTKDYQQMLADLRKANVNKQDAGVLYKVDIADETIPKMLNWDKPITEQKPLLNDLLNQFSGDRRGRLEAYSNQPGATGASFYNALTSELRGQEKASNALNKAGVSGIRYLDNLSRGTGEGTSNYVVFDPNTVKILERNGLLLP